MTAPLRDRLRRLHQRRDDVVIAEDFDRAAELARIVEAERSARQAGAGASNASAPARAPEPLLPAEPAESPPPEAPIPQFAPEPRAPFAATAESPAAPPPHGPTRERLTRLFSVPGHVGPPASFPSRGGRPAPSARDPAAPPPPRPAPPSVGPRAAVPAPRPSAPRRAPLDALLAALPDEASRHGATAIRRRAEDPALQLGRERPARWVDALTRDLGELGLETSARVALRDCAFFDIESTGLRAESCYAFVLGIARPHEDRVRVEQIVPDGEEAERESLQRLSDALDGVSTLVTFNGARFDLPFVRARAERLGVPLPFDRLEHLDLHRIARRLLRRSGHRFSLAAMEANVLGFVREHDLPGREAPAAWEHFRRSGDPSPVLQVLEHNRLDVLSMIPLAGILLGETDLLAATALPTFEAMQAPAPRRQGDASRPSLTPSAPTRPPPTSQPPSAAPPPTSQPPSAASPPTSQPPSAASPPADTSSHSVVEHSAPAEDLCASALVAVGAHDAARAALLFDAALAAGLAGPLRRRALRELGRMRMRLGEPEPAQAALDALCAEFRDDAEAHALLAELHEEHYADLATSLRHAERALHLQAWNSRLREQVARLRAATRH